MRTPRGVSLVEVLVASVLLMVGVAGALQALLAASRLRERAAAREVLARAVESRLAWFQQAACTTTDSLELIGASGTVEESWRVTRGVGISLLEGRATMNSLGGPLRFGLVLERRCP